MNKHVTFAILISLLIGLSTQQNNSIFSVFLGMNNSNIYKNITDIKEYDKFPKACSDNLKALLGSYNNSAAIEILNSYGENCTLNNTQILKDYFNATSQRIMSELEKLVQARFIAGNSLINLLSKKNQSISLGKVFKNAPRLANNYAKRAERLIRTYETMFRIASSPSTLQTAIPTFKVKINNTNQTQTCLDVKYVKENLEDLFTIADDAESLNEADSQSSLGEIISNINQLFAKKTPSAKTQNVAKECNKNEICKAAAACKENAMKTCGSSQNVSSCITSFFGNTTNVDSCKSLNEKFDKGLKDVKENLKKLEEKSKGYEKFLPEKMNELKKKAEEEVAKKKNELNTKMNDAKSKADDMLKKATEKNK